MGSPFAPFAYNERYPAREAETLSVVSFTLLLSFIGPPGGMLRSVAVWLAFASQNGLVHYIKSQLNDPFAKLPHPWTWFDAECCCPTSRS